MKRWLPLLGLAVLLLGALIVGSRSSGPQTPQQRADALAGRVKCPTCKGLSVAQSKTELAVAIHDEIERQVNLGKTDAQIISFISSKYGDGLLINPPATGAGAVVWVAPIAFLLVAFAGLVVALRRWSASGRREVDDTDLAAVQRARQAAHS
jgi:cytochrome c-type biogenesis protein CcmH